MRCGPTVKLCDLETKDMSSVGLLELSEDVGRTLESHLVSQAWRNWRREGMRFVLDVPRDRVCTSSCSCLGGRRGSCGRYIRISILDFPSSLPIHRTTNHQPKHRQNGLQAPRTRFGWACSCSSTDLIVQCTLPLSRLQHGDENRRRRRRTLRLTHSNRQRQTRSLEHRRREA